jgi:hypothetical protein
MQAATSALRRSASIAAASYWREDGAIFSASALWRRCRAPLSLHLSLHFSFSSFLAAIHFFLCPRPERKKEERKREGSNPFLLLLLLLLKHSQTQAAIPIDLRADTSITSLQSRKKIDSDWRMLQG